MDYKGYLPGGIAVLVITAFISGLVIFISSPDNTTYQVIGSILISTPLIVLFSVCIISLVSRWRNSRNNSLV